MPSSLDSINLTSYQRLIKLIPLLGLIYGLNLLNGCRQTSQWVPLNGSTMGTYYTVHYWSHSKLPTASALQQALEQRLVRINQLMSTYRPQAEISRFNQSQMIDQPFPMAVETLTVIREAVRIHQLTEGALDITMGPLVNLWGFGPTPPSPNRLPRDTDIDQYRTWTGINQLNLHQQAVSKKIPQLSLDLSAIGKGYGVDYLADYLDELGIEHYLINIGGEIRCKGNNPQNQPWRIAIENPLDPAKPPVRSLGYSNGAMATSGDYRIYFEHENIRYAHTLDPRTGKPITHALISATVLHPSCMTADGLATAFLVLGPEKALSIANQQQIPLMLLIKTADGITERYSNAFQPYLTQLRER